VVIVFKKNMDRIDRRGHCIQKQYKHKQKTCLD
jgi:hypothetical protein